MTAVWVIVAVGGAGAVCFIAAGTIAHKWSIPRCGNVWRRSPAPGWQELWTCPLRDGHTGECEWRAPR